MQHLKANTSVKVVIGPFVDVSDGFTPETGVTLSGADEAEIIKHDADSVTDISSNTWAAITNCDGYYNLTLTTTDTNTEGMLTIVVQDDSVCLPVRATFMVMAEAAYDSMYTAKDTGYMDVNIKAISEDTTAADNLEAAVDGTGLTFTNCVMPTVTTLTGHTAQTGDVYASLPTNFSDLSITATTGRVDVASVAGTSQTANDNGADINAIKAVTDNLPDSGALTTINNYVDCLPASLNDISVADILAGVVDNDGTNIDMEGAFKLLLSAATAKLSGAATTTVTIRDIADTKARITATVDADGNRTAVTRDAT